MRGFALVVSIAAALLSACSSTVYETEIASFRTSTVSATSTVDQYLDGAVATMDQIQTDIAFRTAGRMRVGLSDACDAIASSDTDIATEDRRCEVLLNGQALGSTQADRSIADTKAIMKLLADYADNLATVAAAKNVEAVNVAAEGVSGSVGALVPKLEEPALQGEGGQKALGATVAAVSAGVGPATALFNWASANYLNYKRYHVLKQAVGLVDGPLQRAEPKLIALALTAQKTYAQHLIVAYSTAADPVRWTDAPADALRVAELRERAADVATIVNADASKAFAALIEAHGALRAALDDPKRQAKSLLKSIKAFGKAAKDLADAFK